MKEALLRWSDKYLIGEDEIDLQHKNLLNLINILYKQLNKPGIDRDETFRTAIKDAVQHVKYHFSSEQKFMEKINYPLIEEQKKMHNSFITGLLEDVKRYENGDSQAPIHFVRFLREWFLRHVSIEDMKIGFFLQKCNRTDKKDM